MNRIALISERLFLAAVFALAFFIPLFPKVLPILIIAVIAALVIKLIITKENIYIHRNLWMLLPFYLVHLAGITYTENISHGLLDLQIKLSLFIFPLVFIFSSISYLECRKILIFFVAGCSASIIFNLAGSSINFYSEYKITGDLNYNHFFYFNLSSLIHPSYMAMYFCLAVSILLNWIKNGFLIVNRLYLYVLILIFILFIFMLSSRAGILSLAAVLIYHFIIVLESRITLRRILLPLVFILASVALYLVFVPGATDRLEINPDLITGNKEIAKDTDDSSEIRVLVWQSSIEIIKNNLLTGVGTGDIKNALMQIYSERKIKWAEAFQLNAHNQFLQSWAALGLFGFVSLLPWVLYSLISGIKKGYLPQIILGIIVFINFLFESMLETQAGTVFIGFFTCLFFSRYDSQKKFPIEKF